LRRLLSDENFNGDIVRGLFCRLCELDLFRNQAPLIRFGTCHSFASKSPCAIQLHMEKTGVFAVLATSVQVLRNRAR
jgi:hypothetical protein